jgi:hypothetical protein
MPLLSLDCLTLTDTSPEDLIRSADQAGFDLVSLWVHPHPVYPRQQLTSATVPACRALLAETGIGVHAVEAVDVVTAQEVLSFRPAPVHATMAAPVCIMPARIKPPSKDKVNSPGACTLRSATTL